MPTTPCPRDPQAADPDWLPAPIADVWKPDYVPSAEERNARTSTSRPRKNINPSNKPYWDQQAGVFITTTTTHSLEPLKISKTTSATTRTRTTTKGRRRRTTTRSPGGFGLGGSTVNLLEVGGPKRPAPAVTVPTVTTGNGRQWSSNNKGTTTSTAKTTLLPQENLKNKGGDQGQQSKQSESTQRKPTNSTVTDTNQNWTGKDGDQSQQSQLSEGPQSKSASNNPVKTGTKSSKTGSRTQRQNTSRRSQNPRFSSDSRNSGNTRNNRSKNTSRRGQDSGNSRNSENSRNSGTSRNSRPSQRRVVDNEGPPTWT